jgi:hypothetical protein
VNWRTYIAGIITGIPVAALAKYGFDVLVHRAGERAQKQRDAARALIEATWHLQHSAWFYASLRQPGVALPARDLDNQEQKALGDFSAALAVFRQDYEWPVRMAKAAGNEMQRLDIAMVNLKAFYMTGQYEGMMQAASEVQQACEKIREAAKPYAYSLWRRVWGIS